MKHDIPAWATRTVSGDDLALARDAQGRGVMQVAWPDLAGLRRWAKDRGWPTPWTGFEPAFVSRLLDNPADFARALDESGVRIRIPASSAAIPADRVADLDALYAARSDSGRPTSWGALVEELREIRRAVEAGVAVLVEGGPELRTWQDFYAWAHGRYHMLEDGYDRWIGDDRD